MTYKLKVACPRCGWVPSVRFAERHVIRARRERQGALIQLIQCDRDRPLRCRYRWWIRARDIADAVPERPIGEPAAPSVDVAPAEWPEGFPERAQPALRAAGIASVRDLLELDDWLSIPGIGPATEREMRAALAEPSLND